MSFWKTLGKIGGVVAPFALAPFTGGMSLLAQGAIGAGAGAGLGALGGGKKGALVGGLSGLIPGIGKAAMAKGGVPGLSGISAAGDFGGEMGGASGGLGGIFGFLSKLKQAGIDPTTLGLGGLSLLGGQPQQPGQSFHKGVSPEAAQLVDPIQSLFNALHASQMVGQGLNDRIGKGVQLRSTAPPPPQPIHIPGLPFQIGGGLGTDPALKDPSLLTLPGLNFNQPFGDPNPGQAAPKKRTPNG